MSEMKWIKTPSNFQWFKDSPEAGSPECLCSICAQMIGEEEMALRLWSPRKDLEARLCERCQEEYLGIKYTKDEDDRDYWDEGDPI